MESLPAQLRTLQLSASTAPTPGQLTEALLSDLLPSPAPLPDALSSLGYTNLPTNHAALLSFLLTTLRVQRMLLPTPPSPSPPPAPNDTQLADALSRVRTSLSLAPSDGPPEKLFAEATAAVELLAGTPGAPLLVETREVAGTGGLLAALGASHDAAVDLLMHRFSVTAQAFASSPALRSAEPYLATVRRAAVRARAPVTLFAVRAARAELLEPVVAGAVETPVKAVVIGSVPDRGGRVFAHGMAMPTFRGRIVGMGNVGGGRKGGKKRRGR